MLVIAHRGSSKKAPENTLMAFRQCIADGADGVEFDTYQHPDDTLVFHDRWLNRTTNGSGRLLESSIDYLRGLDAGRGERIPTLKETLHCLPASMLCNVEIKYLCDARQWLYRFDEAREGSALQADDIVISSFQHHWLAAVKALRPTLTIGALTASIPEDGVTFATELDAWSVNVDINVIDKAYVRLAHNAGLKVMVFTVDYLEDMLLLRDWGVDAIFTNVPDIARQTLA